MYIWSARYRWTVSSSRCSGFPRSELLVFRLHRPRIAHTPCSLVSRSHSLAFDSLDSRLGSVPHKDSSCAWPWPGTRCSLQLNEMDSCWVHCLHILRLIALLGIPAFAGNARRSDLFRWNQRPAGIPVKVWCPVGSYKVFIRRDV